MYAFRKSAPAKSIMFAVSYDDGRTAYLWIEDHLKASADRIAGAVARERQQQGALPDGTITSVKRVR